MTTSSIIPDSKILVIVFLGCMVFLSFLGVDLKSLIYKSLFSPSFSPSTSFPITRPPSNTPNKELVSSGSTFYIGTSVKGSTVEEKEPNASKELASIIGASAGKNNHNIPSVSNSLESRGNRKTKPSPTPTESVNISSHPV